MRIGATSDPVLSVIVPTDGRCHLVERLLRSLEAARARFDERCETLVVDSSQGEEADRIAAASACRDDVRYVPGPVNVRAKRNLAARLATGRWLLFVDSDCEADPELLVAHARSWARHVGAVGSVGITRFHGPHTLATRAAAASPFMDAFQFADSMTYIPWATMTNTVILRSAFQEAGGFDESLPFRLGGDDLDLTWRLTESGGLLLAAPEAVVLHTRETWTRPGSVVKRVWRWGRVDHHLMRKHAHLLRGTLPRPTVPTVLLFLALLAFLTPVRDHTSPVAFTLAGVVPITNAALLGRGSDHSLAARIGAYALVRVFRVGTLFESLLRRQSPRPFREVFYDTPSFPGDVHLRSVLGYEARNAWVWTLTALVTVVAW